MDLNSTDTSFEMMYRWQYNQNGYEERDSVNNASKVALLFMGFEKVAFQHDYYKINDSLLFISDSGKINRVMVNGFNIIPGNQRKHMVTIEICYLEGNLESEAHGQLIGVAPGESIDYWYEGSCESYNIWVDDGTDGGNGGTTGDSPPVPPGTSGGAPDDGSWNDDPCDPLDDGGNIPATRTQVQDPCDDPPAWEPEPLPILEDEPPSIDLSILLDLTNEQGLWLTEHPAYIAEITAYLQYSDEPAKIEISKEHLDRMMNDVDYFTFVENHGVNGIAGLVWWEDEDWLNDSNNFSLDLTNENEPYDELTAEEKVLIGIFPTQAYTIGIINRPKAFLMADEKFGPGGGLNDKKDAFRHAFFNAINTRDVLPRILPVPVPSSEIVRLFAVAHESEVPSQLILEKEMDLDNNEVGITYCLFCIPGVVSDESIANGLFQEINEGLMLYLKPIRDPMYSPSGLLVNPLGDPNFYGTNGTNNPETATHGITSLTHLTPTIL